MSVFNDLNISASQLIPDFISGVSSEYLTKDGIPLFGIGLYLLVLVTTFISAKRNSTFGGALVFASVLGIFVSGILVKLGLLSNLIFYLTLGLFAAGFAILWYEKDSP